MIIITGTQRSGTSFMAKYMKNCGFDLGTNFWDKRIDGGLESPDICNFFRDWLGDNSFPFSMFWEFIGREQFRSFHELHEFQSLAKFSYLLMIPEFVDMWYFSRGNQDKFIIMDRNLRKVAQSRRSKQAFQKEDWPLLNQSYKQLKHNRRKSLAKMRKYRMPYTFVPFPKVTIAEVADAVEQFAGLSLPANAEKIWLQTFDPSKIHFK